MSSSLAPVTQRRGKIPQHGCLWVVYVRDARRWWLLTSKHGQFIVRSNYDNLCTKWISHTVSHLKHAKKTTTATTFYSICTEDKKAHVSAVRHLRDETHKKVLEGKTACTKKKKNHIDGSKFNSALYGIYNYAFHTLIRLLKYWHHNKHPISSCPWQMLW